MTRRAFDKIAEGLREATGWRRLEAEEAKRVREAIAKIKLRERSREG